MTNENKTIILKRIKSFLWRSGMLLVAGGIDFLIVNLGLFDMPDLLTISIGLILGEISKELNK